MSTAIDGTGLEVVSLTTIGEVKQMIGSSYTSTQSDSLIESAILAVSDEITRYLGFHTLTAERTETYALKHGKRILSLDGRFVTGGLSDFKVAAHPDDFATAIDLVSTDFVLSEAAGWLRFMARPTNWNGYARLTYTSGLGLTALEVIADHREIAYAATLQTKYFIQRQDSLGGNVTSLQGGGTSFNGQYTLLREVRSILDANRKQAV